MTDAITRCPKCKTSFKVSNEHLSTARGAVRCGSCLTIFNAKEHLVTVVEEPRKKPPKEASKKSAAEQPEPADDVVEDNDDDLLINDDDDDDDNTEEATDAIGFDENIFLAKGASKSDINLFERRIKDSNDNEHDHAEADESWALSLLEDNKEDEKNEQAELSFKIPEETIKHEEDHRTPAFHVIEDDYSEPAVEHAATFSETDSDIIYSETNIHTDEDYLEPFEDEPVENEPNENASNGGFIDSFELEPLELHVKHSSPFWHSNYFWFSISLIAVFTAITQLAYFNFDTWSRQQNLRPYYATACNMLGCNLPVLQDLNRIRIENMIVIDHPKQDGMLLVDTTLLNQAKFEQYFPTLMLTFTNLQNEVLSKHQFTPDKYVGGELAGKKLMPANHPIHITLDIPDPGSNAVNYQISVVKP